MLYKGLTTISFLFYLAGNGTGIRPVHPPCTYTRVPHQRAHTGTCYILPALIPVFRIKEPIQVRAKMWH